MQLLHDAALGWDAFAAAGLRGVVAWVTVAAALLGVVPGLAPAAVLAIALPFALRLGAPTAAVLLITAYAGAHVGTALRGVLAARPGWVDPMEVDGQQLARQGRAASAVGAATLASFTGGMAAMAVAAVAAAPLHRLASGIGPAETFALGVLVLAGSVGLGAGPLLKGLAMAACGVMLSTTGVLDGWLGGGHGTAQGKAAGQPFAVLAMGLYGFGALIDRAMAAETLGTGRPGAEPLPARALWQAAVAGTMRGTAIGLLLGMLPGGGARLAAWLAHRAERQRAVGGHAAGFGKGDFRAVCAPPAARQAGAHMALLPLAVLGLPLNATLAVLAGAIVLRNPPADFWSAAAGPAIWWTGLAALAWSQAAMLLLALPLAAVSARLLQLPRAAVIGLLAVVCCAGIHALRGHVDDVLAAALCAVAGHGLRLLGCSVGPLLVGYVLAPTLDDSLRRTLQAAGGDWAPLLTRPLAAIALGTALLVLLLCAVPPIATRRRAALQTSRTLPTEST